MDSLPLTLVICFPHILLSNFPFANIYSIHDDRHNNYF